MSSVSSFIESVWVTSRRKTCLQLKGIIITAMPSTKIDIFPWHLFRRLDPEIKNGGLAFAGSTRSRKRSRGRFIVCSRWKEYCVLPAREFSGRLRKVAVTPHSFLCKAEILRSKLWIVRDHLFQKQATSHTTLVLIHAAIETGATNSSSMVLLEKLLAKCSTLWKKGNQSN